ncbi:MAG: alpha-glucuronidase, partial [Chitinophagaceae bacterium]
MYKFFLILICISHAITVSAEDGYRLWLRYDRVKNGALVAQYRNAISGVFAPDTSLIFASARQELLTGLSGLLDVKYTLATRPGNGTVVVATKSRLPQDIPATAAEYERLGDEGYAIVSISNRDKKITLITANTD